MRIAEHFHIGKGGFLLESILCVDIPVQMRFRFRDKTGELITVTIDKVLSEDQAKNKVGIHFSCAANIYGTQKTFSLWYSYFAHEWRLARLNV